MGNMMSIKAVSHYNVLDNLFQHEKIIQHAGI